MACMNHCYKPFQFAPCCDLDLDLLQGQSCCQAGDHNSRNLLVFSAPEPKAQVHYCDHALSVVCPSVVRRPSLTFHIFDFSSETAEQNSTKLEARSQCPLPSLCFSGRSENKIGHPGWFLKKVAHCTQVHDMWPFGPLVSNGILIFTTKQNILFKTIFC